VLECCPVRLIRPMSSPSFRPPAPITWESRRRQRVSVREGAKRFAIANRRHRFPTACLFSFSFSLDRPPGLAAARVRRAQRRGNCLREPRGKTFRAPAASSWAPSRIYHDRVLVSPVAWEPRQMPFSGKAIAPGGVRFELGLATRRLDARICWAAGGGGRFARLTPRHYPRRGAPAENLLEYLRDQAAPPPGRSRRATNCARARRDEPPATWRFPACLSPLRGSFTRPLGAMAVAARIREETGTDVETRVGERPLRGAFHGMCISRPDRRLLLPDPDEVQAPGRGRPSPRRHRAVPPVEVPRSNAAAGSLLLPQDAAGAAAQPLLAQRKKLAGRILALCGRIRR